MWIVPGIQRHCSHPCTQAKYQMIPQGASPPTPITAGTVNSYYLFDATPVPVSVGVAPAITGFLAGPGGEHSILGSIQLQFNEQVTLSGSAMLMDGSPVSFSTSDGINYNIEDFGDGVHEITIVASQVTDSSGQNMAGDQSMYFWQLFGDFA